MSAEAGSNPTLLEDPFLAPEITAIDELQVVVDAYVDVLRTRHTIYDEEDRDPIRAAAVGRGIGLTEVRVALLSARLLLSHAE